MIRDSIVLAVLVVAFATLLTVHVALAFGLARQPPRWRGLVALVVAPLAPWWGWHARLRARAIVWLAAAFAYAVALVIASH